MFSMHFPSEKLVINKYMLKVDKIHTKTKCKLFSKPEKHQNDVTDSSVY